jgi:hypothetical protein
MFGGAEEVRSGSAGPVKSGSVGAVIESVCVASTSSDLAEGSKIGSATGKFGSTAGTGEASGSGMLEGSILAVLSLGRSRLSRCRTSNTESVLTERARFGES